MKTTVLAIALAFATMPLTFAAQNPPAKTDSTAKPAATTVKKSHKDTAKKAVKKDATASKASTGTPATPATPAAAATPAPVKK
jgi:hypothetical protein